MNLKKPKFVKTAFSNYKVIQIVGQGGNGFVYEADEDGKKVAIKILDPARATGEKLKRFENEYRFCSVKRHCNIIHVIDHGITDDDAPFFVMPLYEGSVRELIGKLNEDQCYSLVRKLIDGVEASHKYGVTHRDLKPENILYGKSREEVVLADFGIAEFGVDDLYTAVETKDGTRLANFQYAAPEQRVRNGVITMATDIYSLGLIFNEIFTGELALGKNHKIIGDVSDKYSYLDAIIERMLQQNSSSRYQQMEEVKRDMSTLSKEYISSLKISELDNTVIPAHEVDDPIVADPIRIVDVNWDKGTLNIHLNHNPNLQWQIAFQNMRNYSHITGKGPDAFKFKGSNAIISARTANQSQGIINHFKQWLPRVAQEYENKLRQDAKNAEQKKIDEVRRIKAAEEEKKTINEILTF